jgi:hypothetical protein
MTSRPRFVVTFSPTPRVDGIRALRLLLKSARRRFGLVAVDAFEDRSSSLEISNRAADEFRKLRDEVVAERAARILPNQMPKEKAVDTENHSYGCFATYRAAAAALPCRSTSTTETKPTDGIRLKPVASKPVPTSKSAPVADDFNDDFDSTAARGEFPNG